MILLFINTSCANIGDGTGLVKSAADGDFWISLHTADPTDTGSITNEATYGSYARKSIGRGAANWTVSGDTVDNDAAILFIEATSGSETLTHIGIHTASSGAGNMIVYGVLTGSLLVSTGIAPNIPIGDLDIIAA